jgi:cell fate regulator YaaT (PSP1 superfamily)
MRTSRGLEIGEILGPCDDALERGQSDGAIIRGMTVEDELLEARLQAKRLAALTACEELLQTHHSPAVLMDVEHLFDGQTVYFYFLGDVPAETELLTQQLAATYTLTTKFQQFSETLEHGCGPDCGTEAAAGHGCSTCGAGCAIAGACGPKLKQ